MSVRNLQFCNGVTFNSIDSLIKHVKNNYDMNG